MFRQKAKAVNRWAFEKMLEMKPILVLLAEILLLLRFHHTSRCVSEKKHCYVKSQKP